jgi:transcriptional regulator GlxA family with amidase domain
MGNSMGLATRSVNGANGTLAEQSHWLDTNKPRPSLTVGLLLSDNFTLNAFSGFVDALRLAADTGGRSRQIACGWRVMARTMTPIISSSTVAVLPTSGLIAPTNFDYIAVCAGNDYTTCAENPTISHYVREASAQRVPLIGICTGTFHLARAGLMRDRTACVHWNVIESYREQFPGHEARVDRIFIEDGNIISCAGSVGAIDLALHLIKRHLGAGKSHQCMRHMMLATMRPSDFPQAHFYDDLTAVQDLRVRRAVQIMEQRIDDNLTMNMIASHLDLSPRQLERLFQKHLGTGPAAYFRRMRTNYASWLLAHSEDKIGTIALDCGFSDAAHFAREFRQAFGCTPREYRAKFQRK